MSADLTARAREIAAGLDDIAIAYLDALVHGPRSARLAIPTATWRFFATNGLAFDNDKSPTPFPTDLGRAVAAVLAEGTVK